MKYKAEPIAAAPDLQQLNPIHPGQIFQAEEFADLWADWVADRSETTRAGYNVCIKSFLAWIAENGIERPTRRDLVNYKEYLTTPHASRKNGQIIELSADTAARYFRGVKMFFAFLESNGLYPDISKNIRSPKTHPGEFKRDFFEREDVLRILENIDTDTITGARDYSMILCIVSCAFRIIEIQRANVGDLEARGNEYRLYIKGKGHDGKDAYKKIEPEVYKALSAYLKARGNVTNDAPLFAAVESHAKEGGGRLTEPSISRIIKGRIVAAGYDSTRLTAHSLRHTSVTLDRRAGGSLEAAKRHARHSSILVTQRYDHSLDKTEANDERRILDYLFNGDNPEPDEKRAADLLERIPVNKRRQALEMLEALAT